MAKLIALGVGNSCSAMSPDYSWPVSQICDWTNSDRESVRLAISELSNKNILTVKETRPGIIEFHLDEGELAGVRKL